LAVTGEIVISGLGATQVSVAVLDWYTMPCAEMVP
jgi:hypothetical protein